MLLAYPDSNVLRSVGDRNEGAEREPAAWPASRSSHRRSSWLLRLAARRPGRGRRRPAQTRPQLLVVVGEVAEAIAASLAARPHDREALVFTAPMGGPLRRADFVRNYFKPAVLAANEAMTKLPKDQRPALLPEGLQFYDLRHTCASLLIAQGASVRAVQAQLGHATASITLDTYGHLFPSEMEALANRLELVRDAALAKRGRTQ